MGLCYFRNYSDYLGCTIHNYPRQKIKQIIELMGFADKPSDAMPFKISAAEREIHLTMRSGESLTDICSLPAYELLSALYTLGILAEFQVNPDFEPASEEEPSV